MAEEESFEYSSGIMVWIWRIIVITFIAIYIFVFTANYISKDIDTSALEVNLLKERLLFSPNCLAYEDKYPQPGIIDLGKFESINLNNCYKKNKFNFELKLKDMNNQEIKSVQSSPGSQISLLCGAVNVKCSKLKEYVLIKDQVELKPAILEVYATKNG